jgi:hypothetical protein
MNDPRNRTLLYIKARECLRHIDPFLTTHQLANLAKHAVESGLVYENARGEVVFLTAGEVTQ